VEQLDAEERAEEKSWHDHGIGTGVTSIQLPHLRNKSHALWWWTFQDLRRYSDKVSDEADRISKLAGNAFTDRYGKKHSATTPQISAWEEVVGILRVQYNQASHASWL